MFFWWETRPAIPGKLAKPRKRRDLGKNPVWTQTGYGSCPNPDSLLHGIPQVMSKQLDVIVLFSKTWVVLYCTWDDLLQGMGWNQWQVWKTSMSAWCWHNPDWELGYIAGFCYRVCSLEGSQSRVKIIWLGFSPGKLWKLWPWNSAQPWRAWNITANRWLMPPFTGLALGLGRRNIKGFLLPIGTLWPQRRKIVLWTYFPCLYIGYWGQSAL